MKNVTILIFSLFLYGNLRAQDTMINNVVKLSIPKKATRIKTADIEILRSRTAMVGDAMSNGGTVYYEIGGIIVSVLGEEESNQLDLRYLKKGLNGMASRVPGYTSEIIKIKDGEALIQNFDLNQNGYYIIFLNSLINKKSLSGKIEYPLSKQKEAKAILDKLLKSIRFTKE